MKKIITIVIVIIVITSIFFIKINYKSLKFGNNISSKSAEKIAQYILDINSYEAQETITVETNKNSNIYVVKEECIKDNNMFRQDILEPENLNGVSFIYDGTNLKIKNNKLNLNKIYENYQYIGESTITLMDFINDYKESEETNLSDNGEEIILETKLKNGNKYIAYKKLYNEIKINNLQKEDILAFKLEELTNDI